MLMVVSERSTLVYLAAGGEFGFAMKFGWEVELCGSSV